MPQAVRPRVVVVGGSFAGLCTARHLKRDAEVVLIEPRDYFEYTPGACHLMAGSGSFSALLSPMEQVCQGVRHECGWFAGLSGGHVAEGPNTQPRLLVQRCDSDGSSDSKAAPLMEMAYDALVICTGVPYNAPIRASAAAQTYQGRVGELEAFRERVGGCKNIVVVGGGLVGVELAAEFAVRLEHRPKITLISRGALLNTLPDKAGMHAMNWMRKNKVDVLIGDEVQEHNSQGETLLTQKGIRIPVDLLIDCTGQAATPSFPPPTSASSKTSSTSPDISNSGSSNGSRINSPLGLGTAASSLPLATTPLSVIWPFNKDGLVLVDEHLQAVQFSEQGIFAAGDVIEHQQGVGFAMTSAKGGELGALSLRPTVRNAHLAESQAELCAANVRRFLLQKKSVPGSTAPAHVHHLLQYPRDVFGAPLNPLLACVSLGPRHAILVVNGVVLGGAVLGFVAALAKFVVERSKVAEIRQQTWGRAFWAFGHVVVNAIHAAYVNSLGFMSRFQRIRQREGFGSTAASLGK